MSRLQCEKPIKVAGEAAEGICVRGSGLITWHRSKTTSRPLCHSTLTAKRILSLFIYFSWVFRQRKSCFCLNDTEKNSERFHRALRLFERQVCRSWLVVAAVPLKCSLASRLAWWRHFGSWIEKILQAESEICDLWIRMGIGIRSYLTPKLILLGSVLTSTCTTQQHNSSNNKITFFFFIS